LVLLPTALMTIFFCLTPLGAVRLHLSKEKQATDKLTWGQKCIVSGHGRRSSGLESCHELALFSLLQLYQDQLSVYPASCEINTGEFCQG
jgi:hypothetical protein